jgi:hypothetical protein
MFKSIGNLVSALGSYASLAGLYCTVRPSTLPYTTFEDFLILLSIILAVFHIVFEVFSILKDAPMRLKTEKSIEQYMRGWVKLAGRTSILARDMSWVEEEMEIILNELASRNNLTIFMESQNSLAVRLKKRGAEVLYYEGLQFLPFTRFAMTNEGRGDARVALGFKGEAGLGVHEYTIGHPVFHLCSDIINLLRVKNRAL